MPRQNQSQSKKQTNARSTKQDASMIKQLKIKKPISNNRNDQLPGQQQSQKMKTRSKIADKSKSKSSSISDEEAKSLKFLFGQSYDQHVSEANDDDDEDDYAEDEESVACCSEEVRGPNYRKTSPNPSDKKKDQMKNNDSNKDQQITDEIKEQKVIDFLKSARKQAQEKNSQDLIKCPRENCKFRTKNQRWLVNHVRTEHAVLLIRLNICEAACSYCRIAFQKESDCQRHKEQSCPQRPLKKVQTQREKRINTQYDDLTCEIE